MGFGICSYILARKFTVNVGKYSRDGSYGNERKRSYWRYTHFPLNHDCVRKGSWFFDFGGGVRTPRLLPCDSDSQGERWFGARDDADFPILIEEIAADIWFELIPSTWRKVMQKTWCEWGIIMTRVIDLSMLLISYLGNCALHWLRGWWKSPCVLWKTRWLATKTTTFPNRQCWHLIT